MVPHLFLCLALVCLGVGLLQFRPVAARKIGFLVLWLSTGVLVWALSGAWWAGLAGLLLWIVFPLWELISVLRRLQIPRVRRLEDAFTPVGSGAFPDLEALTGEMEALGFRHVGDCDLLPAPQRQFFRLFDREDGLHQAFVGWIGENGGNGESAGGFHFAAFLSQEGGRGHGRYWMTWNYPLSYGLKTPPRLTLHRALRCPTLEDLFDEHGELLRLNGVEAAAAALLPAVGLEPVRRRLETVLARQLHYNVQVGVLTREGVGDGFRYSWRGAFRVAGEVFRDLARL
ncbi:hypothetical protein SAMN05444156_0875 [Verrucomicrobium sp. GAS474]|uniref:hypothetical protein n=1 Tax=Verrucomicrobium sp. GAS474 TaxID=1882831 RepID=UPI00087A6778|nr:hypothetical protein [Verrucomicrobium sp. GAS474]SDT93479.1 hypothetical protein SAMN05444156_0875 [Verrucomicrobium sp. GAS474]